MLAAQRALRPEGRRVTNVVVMGMGEPFHNYDETLRACRLLNDPDGFALAARAISVSTAGVVPGIERFAAEPLQLNLAVSLHAATDALRDKLVPLNRRYPLDALFAACETYVGRTRRKLFFEYVVLAGVNDTPEQVKALVARLRRPLYHLNLIAYNEAGRRFARPTREALEALRSSVEAGGVKCTVRRSPGDDIEAACGQLALRREAEPASIARRSEASYRRRGAGTAARSLAAAAAGSTLTIAISLPSSKPAMPEGAARSRCASGRDP